MDLALHPAEGWLVLGVTGAHFHFRWGEARGGRREGGQGKDEAREQEEEGG